MSLEFFIAAARTRYCNWTSKAVYRQPQVLQFSSFSFRRIRTISNAPLTSSSSAYHLSPASQYRTITTTSPKMAEFHKVDLSALSDSECNARYRPFILPEDEARNDWISELELDTVERLAQQDLEATGERLKVLVLYGSLRSRSYSCLMAYEASRILHRLHCDVRIFDPAGLPMKDENSVSHPRVQELRSLSLWSDAHVWCCPEQHGTLTAVFKNQIDWIPLSVGSVRPTQGRTLALIQVNGGSQSFNTVNSLRILGRWMRMFTIPNQSSLPKAYTQFTDEGRLMESGNRDRLVDVCEELVKYTIVMKKHFEAFGDRFSERKEKRVKEERERAKWEEVERSKSAEMEVRDKVNGVDIGSI